MLHAVQLSKNLKSTNHKYLCGIHLQICLKDFTFPTAHHDQIKAANIFDVAAAVTVDKATIRNFRMMLLKM